jgi:hypothetical protein
MEIQGTRSPAQDYYVKAKMSLEYKTMPPHRQKLSSVLCLLRVLCL